MMITLQVDEKTLGEQLSKAIADAIVGDSKKSEVLRETIQWAANGVVQQLVNDYTEKNGDVDKILEDKIFEKIDQELTLTGHVAREVRERLIEKRTDAVAEELRSFVSEILSEKEDAIIEMAVKAASDKLAKKGAKHLFSLVEERFVSEITLVEKRFVSDITLAEKNFVNELSAEEADANG